MFRRNRVVLTREAVRDLAMALKHIQAGMVIHEPGARTVEQRDRDYEAYYAYCRAVAAGKKPGSLWCAAERLSALAARGEARRYRRACRAARVRRVASGVVWLLRHPVLAVENRREKQRFRHALVEAGRTP